MKERCFWRRSLYRSDLQGYLEQVQHSFRRHGVVPVVYDELLFICIFYFNYFIVFEHWFHLILGRTYGFSFQVHVQLYTTTSTAPLAILHPLKLLLATCLRWFDIEKWHRRPEDAFWSGESFVSYQGEVWHLEWSKWCEVPWFHL